MYWTKYYRCNIINHHQYYSTVAFGSDIIMADTSMKILLIDWFKLDLSATQDAQRIQKLLIGFTACQLLLVYLMPQLVFFGSN